LSALVSTADGERVPLQPLASALRVLALRAFDPEAQVGATNPGGDEGNQVSQIDQAGGGPAGT